MNDDILYDMLKEWDDLDSMGIDVYYHLIAEFPTIDDFPNILEFKIQA